MHPPRLLLLPLFITASVSPAIEAPEIIVVPAPEGGIQPVAEADGNGNIHLLFFHGDPGHGDIHHTIHRSDSGAFRKSVRVNSVDGSAMAIGAIRGAQLALGREGHVHVAWMGSGKVTPNEDHHRAPMLYTRSTDGGRTFEPDRNLITRAFGLDGGGSVAADDSGRVQVFWHAGERGGDETGRRVWVARSTDDGKSFAPEVSAWDEPTGACGCCGMTAGASGGTTWALYRAAADRVHRDVYLLRSKPGDAAFEGRRLDQWETETCPMSAMSLAFADDTTAAAWETADGGLAFTRIGSDVRGEVPPGDAPRKYPDLALAPDGHVLVAWIDGAGWNRGGRLAWQLFDATGRPLGEPSTGPKTAVWTKPAAVFDGESFLVFH